MNKGQILTEAIDLYDRSILDKIDYNIICISNRLDLVERAVQNIQHLNIFVSYRNIRCFSKLINLPISESNKEFNIILNHKTQPEEKDIIKILNLLNIGYGMVLLNTFHLFGFSKQLFRTIGHFDERYIPGEYEDADFLIRMHEANIAWYLNTELKDYINLGSGFSGSDQPRAWFEKKWGMPNTHDLTKYKRFENEQINYDFGQKNNIKFLDFSFTVDSNTPGFKNI